MFLAREKYSAWPSIQKSHAATANSDAYDSSRSKRKHRLKNTNYLPMLPSYLASQPGGKGSFCHGWNCVQAFAIFVFTS